MGTTATKATTQTGKQYLDTAEAAQQISTTVDHIITLIHSGCLRAINIAARTGKPRWRIAQADIDAFIKARTHQPPTKPIRRKKSKSPLATQFF